MARLLSVGAVCALSVVGHEASAAAAGDPVRGRYIATAADCVACHTVPGKEAYAGGYKLSTPFGALYSSNITSDRETGIGGWTEEQFDRAVRAGKGPNGNLYPAMPYTAYVKMSDQDVEDLWAYISTVKPVHHKVVENQLPFPYNMRILLLGWNMLFFDNSPFKPPAGATPDVVRGAYLVEALEHCGTCHTPKNSFGGDKSSLAFEGAALGGWYAPDVTQNSYLGIGSWNADDMVSYLTTGTNRMTAASGPMSEAIINSTQHLTDSDAHAIAAYMKSIKASSAQKPAAIAADDPVMKLGQHVYESQCEACHVRNGTGIAGMIPTFSGNPGIQSVDPSSMVDVTLAGTYGPATQKNPTGASMPSFEWKLSDAQIAAALTYIRNSWGNAASAVSVKDIDSRKAVLKAG